jgi:hypothetical protein
MRWTAVLALCLLAGCLEEPLGPREPDGEAIGEGGREGRTARGIEDESDPDAIHRYDQEFALTVNPDGYGTVTVGGVTSSNCVLFFDDDADYVLLNGTAVLTWDPVTPAAEPLAIEVLWGAGLSASGASPVTLAFTDLESDGFGLGFMADSTLGSAPVMQPVTLHLSFDYKGDLPGGGKGSCSDGI